MVGRTIGLLFLHKLLVTAVEHLFVCVSENHHAQITRGMHMHERWSYLGVIEDDYIASSNELRLKQGKHHISKMKGIVSSFSDGSPAMPLRPIQGRTYGQRES